LVGRGRSCKGSKKEIRATVDKVAVDEIHTCGMGQHEKWAELDDDIIVDCRACRVAIAKLDGSSPIDCRARDQENVDERVEGAVDSFEIDAPAMNEELTWIRVSEGETCNLIDQFQCTVNARRVDVPARGPAIDDSCIEVEMRGNRLGSEFAAHQRVVAPAKPADAYGPMEFDRCVTVSSASVRGDVDWALADSLSPRHSSEGERRCIGHVICVGLSVDVGTHMRAHTHAHTHAAACECSARTCVRAHSERAHTCAHPFCTRAHARRLGDTQSRCVSAQVILCASLRSLPARFLTPTLNPYPLYE
jgi:hypothetical protein